MRQCTYSATPVKVQSGIHNWLGWSKSGQGKTRWFESCPCRSSEGARDLFYIKAKIVEGLAWKSDPRPSDFDLLSPCHSQSGLLSFPKWLYRFPPDFCQALKKKIIFTIWPYCFTYRGRKKYNVDSCKSSFGPSQTGRMYFNTKHTNQNIGILFFKYTNIRMPKCVKTISVDAMHLFEIYFDVAALLILELVC